MKISSLAHTMMYIASPLFAFGDIAMKSAEVEIVVEEDTPPFTFPEKLYIESCAKEAHNKVHPDGDDYDVDIMGTLHEMEYAYEYDDMDIIDESVEDGQRNRSLRWPATRCRLKRDAQQSGVSCGSPKQNSDGPGLLPRTPPRISRQKALHDRKRIENLRKEATAIKLKIKETVEKIRQKASQPGAYTDAVRTQLRNEVVALKNNYATKIKEIAKVSAQLKNDLHPRKDNEQLVQGIPISQLLRPLKPSGHPKDRKRSHLRTRLFRHRTMGKCQRCLERGKRNLKKRKELNKDVSEVFCQCLANSSFPSMSNIQKCSLSFEDLISLSDPKELEGLSDSNYSDNNGDNYEDLDDSVHDYDDSGDDVYESDNSYDDDDDVNDSDGYDNGV